MLFSESQMLVAKFNRMLREKVAYCDVYGFFILFFSISLQAMNRVRLMCVRIINIVEFLINSRTNEA